MTITWRAVALTALGAVAVIVVPVPGTLLVWALLVALVCALDAALAADPGLRDGVNVRDGEIVPPAVREALGR